MSTTLRKQIHREEFDYPALMAALATYANPNAKVTSLLKKGELIRVKKGLYVFGEAYRRRPYSRELLANLIFGPSFVSLEFALSWWGLIPERVPQVTSVAIGRPREFETPVGTFVYRPTPIGSFHVGMTRQVVGEVSFLMASAERALADKLREDRHARVHSMKGAERMVFEDLRVDHEAFIGLNIDQFNAVAQALGSRKACLCAKLLARMKEK